MKIDQQKFSLTPEMRDYTLRQLAQRMGLHGVDDFPSFQVLTGLTIQYGSTNAANTDQPGIIIRRCEEDDWGALLLKPPNSLEWFPTDAVFLNGVRFPFSDQVPVLFWGEGARGESFVDQRADGKVVFDADLFAGSFFMLSRWEEMVLPAQDEHQRFPASASVAFRQGFLDQPVVDQYALILKAWIKTLSPEVSFTPPSFSVLLSHDIDKIVKHPTAVNHQGADPFIEGLMTLAQLSEEHKLSSAFYFMTADPGEMDEGYYQQDDALRDVVSMLQDRGHEIGFHAGYETYQNPERFKKEKERMDHVIGQSDYGGRQHFLRFEIPETWRLWEQAGLKYDSTLGYEVAEGFRCGTCHPYHPFDIEENREMKLIEIPLVVMGFTMKKMKEIPPDEAATRILELAKRCQAVGGVLAFLWHNTSFHNEWAPYFRAYKEILPILKEMEEGNV